MYSNGDNVRILEDLYDISSNSNTRNEIGTIIRRQFLDGEYQYDVQIARCIVYNLSADQIVRVLTMYNLGNEVIVLQGTYSGLVRDHKGIVIGIRHNNDHGTMYHVDCDGFTVTVPSQALATMPPTPLTLKQTQALKDALALNLLKLIQMYEQTTGTHIADVHLDTTVYVGDGIQVEKVIGVRLVVKL